MHDPGEQDFVGVVVAAGRSTRFGSSTRKQFVDLDGRSVVDRAIDCLSTCPSVAGVVVVLPPDRSGEAWPEGVMRRPDVIAAVPGGATRADSVWAGLEACGSGRFVLVHDAARPLAGPHLVAAVVDATRRHGAAIPGLEVPDTVKRVQSAGGGSTSPVWVEATVDRSSLRLAQTPQGSRLDWLREALDRARRDKADVTDEAAALEHAGRKVAVVSGDAANRKITSPEDLDIARRPRDESRDDLRVGSGFDIHRFGAGRRLVLGGVQFPDQPGLEGHSDADVVLHAAMDALLGAAGLDDIGALFPPDDPAFAGADSRVLGSEVAQRIAAAGFQVVNLDLTVLAERPKIRASARRMREEIARAFHIDADRVGVKATTLERLGALGRREGIACQAVALLRRRG